MSKQFYIKVSLCVADLSLPVASKHSPHLMSPLYFQPNGNTGYAQPYRKVYSSHLPTFHLETNAKRAAPQSGSYPIPRLRPLPVVEKNGK